MYNYFSPFSPEIIYIFYKVFKKVTIPTLDQVFTVHGDAGMKFSCTEVVSNLKHSMASMHP